MSDDYPTPTTRSEWEGKLAATVKYAAPGGVIATALSYGALTRNIWLPSSIGTALFIGVLTTIVTGASFWDYSGGGH